MEPEQQATVSAHNPDLDKIPRSLRCLAWQRLDCNTHEFTDGDRMLVAVPVCINSKEQSKGWKYEISVIIVECDEDIFNVMDSSWEPWGWDISDVDWFVRI